MAEATGTLGGVSEVLIAAEAMLVAARIIGDVQRWERASRGQDDWADPDGPGGGLLAAVLQAQSVRWGCAPAEVPLAATGYLLVDVGRMLHFLRAMGGSTYVDDLARRAGGHAGEDDLLRSYQHARHAVRAVLWATCGRARVGDEVLVLPGGPGQFLLEGRVKGALWPVTAEWRGDGDRLMLPPEPGTAFLSCRGSRRDTAHPGQLLLNPERPGEDFARRAAAQAIYSASTALEHAEAGAPHLGAGPHAEDDPREELVLWEPFFHGYPVVQGVLREAAACRGGVEELAFCWRRARRRLASF